MKKNARHFKILELIKTNDFKTQEEIKNKLIELGFNVTQATICRDLKILNIVKHKSKFIVLPE